MEVCYEISSSVFASSVLTRASSSGLSVPPSCSARSYRFPHVMCRNPFMQGLLAFGCGQCLPCRINRRRIWTHRLMLEASKHLYSAFVTLTYSDEHLPPGGTLVPRDTQLFLKRLRKNYPSRAIRFYCVGEYGDSTHRPHYHLMLFGVSPADQPVIEKAWGKGLIHVGEVNQNTCQYCCGYVTKKMTSKDDERLNGRHPEFARMSLRPGIGAHAMKDIADALTTKTGSKFLADYQGDVPNELIHGKKKHPLGRYLKKQLRGQLGLPELGLDSPALQPSRESMRTLLKGYENAPVAVKKSVVISKTADRAEQQARKFKVRQSMKRKPL